MIKFEFYTLFWNSIYGSSMNLVHQIYKKDFNLTFVFNL